MWLGLLLPGRPLRTRPTPRPRRQTAWWSSEPLSVGSGIQPARGQQDATRSHQKPPEPALEGRAVISQLWLVEICVH